MGLFDMFRRDEEIEITRSALDEANDPSGNDDAITGSNAAEWLQGDQGNDTLDGGGGFVFVDYFNATGGVPEPTGVSWPVPNSSVYRRPDCASAYSTPRATRKSMPTSLSPAGKPCNGLRSRMWSGLAALNVSSSCAAVTATTCSRSCSGSWAGAAQPAAKAAAAKTAAQPRGLCQRKRKRESRDSEGMEQLPKM